MTYCWFFLFFSGDYDQMFDNPLYASIPKAHGRGKDQEHSQRDHRSLPDHMFLASKSSDRESDRPPMPTPRNRSFTCSENQVQPSSSEMKKPVVPSRSEGGMGHSRPPLPFKGPQPPKSRDYRESSEIPIKLRPPARPGQPQPHQDGKETSLSFPTYKLTDNLSHACSSLAHPEVPKIVRSVK